MRHAHYHPIKESNASAEVQNTKTLKQKSIKQKTQQQIRENSISQKPNKTNKTTAVLLLCFAALGLRTYEVSDRRDNPLNT